MYRCRLQHRVCVCTKSMRCIGHRGASCDTTLYRTEIYLCIYLRYQYLRREMELSLHHFPILKVHDCNTATLCLMLQHTAIHCTTRDITSTFSLFAQVHARSHHCRTLQHFASFCDTLQRTATYFNTLQPITPHVTWLAFRF